MAEIRINKRAIIDLNIEVLTGLHIGGSKETYGIGGLDNPVIKNPLDGRPIIPGSSIKGKIRSLLELNGLDDLRLFEPNEDAPTRGIFRDFRITKESANELQEYFGFGIYTEYKTENRINKETGKAEDPRVIERVPAGTVFEGEIIINAYNDDDLDMLISQLKKGFELLEMNYLGGSGTRGYGKVKVNIVSERVV